MADQSSREKLNGNEACLQAAEQRNRLRQVSQPPHDAVIRVYDDAGNLIERPLCTPLTFDNQEQAAIAQREAPGSAAFDLEFRLRAAYQS